MAMRCETLLSYMLRTFDGVDANLFGREILIQSELTLVRRVSCRNTDKFLLTDHFGQQRRWHMAFIPDQGKIEPTVTQVLEDISSPTCERKANLSRHRENFATENGSDDRSDNPKTWCEHRQIVQSFAYGVLFVVNPRLLCFATRREAEVGFNNAQIVQGFGGV
jgi:hypothetical protein